MMRIVGVWILLAAAASAQEVSSGRCLKCHDENVDRGRHKESAHARKGLQCVACHTGIDLETHADEPKVAPVDCARCHDVPRDKHEGQCASCHEPHYGGKATCTGCHDDQVLQFSGSAHARAGSCTNCHAPHEMKKVAPLDSVDTCSKCHGDAALMSKYGISTDVLETYLQDFHGASVRLHRKEGGPSGPMKATCVACHGSHAIAGKGSADSLTIRSNLAKSCAKCHPGANESFAGAWLSHKPPRKSPMVFLVRIAYGAGIPFMIFGLGVFIVLDLRRKLPHPEGGPTIRRFGLLRISEHLFVVVTFFLLIVTGLPQKFHDTSWGEWIILTFGGLETLRWVHRITGFTLAGLAVFHLAVNVIGIALGRVRGEMLVTRKDFTDTIQMIRHFLNPSAPKPRLGRYDFREKFEYWGMLLGTGVMVTTGFILFFPTLFAMVLPGALIPVARTMHSFEAVLALLVIVVWHFYCVRIRSKVFAVDTSIFTGKMPVEQLREEHPEEYDRLKEGGQLG